MTDGFAAAVTVSIPIFALAAGAEARSVRDRLQRPDPEWERDFAQFSAEHELDVEGSAAQVFAFFKSVPRLSRLHTFERVVAVAGAIVWLVVFVMLTIAELLSLVWLADGGPAGHGGLAAFGLWSIGLAMATLIAAPALYLAVPLLLPLDLVPPGLTRAVLPKATSEQGRGFIRRLLGELEGAIDRAGDAIEAESKAGAKGVAQATADAADGAAAGRPEPQRSDAQADPKSGEPAVPPASAPGPAEGT
jgi:hypothetical protein